jgi:hypothetical protein
MGQATPAPKLWVVVPCKGRRAFLERTTASVLSERELGYCLVDYDCPDRCGIWLQQNFAADVAAGRALVETVHDRRYFNKSAAHNLGARRALAAGAAFLAFLDADIVCRPGFAAWLAPRLAPGRFWIAGPAPDGWEYPGLVGFLALAAQDFEASGGFDEAFRGWGAEDLELRLRLHLAHGLAYDELPGQLLEGLPHGDELRVEHYEIKDLDRSHLANQVYLARKLRRQLGRGLDGLDATAERLIRRIPTRALTRA